MAPQVQPIAQSESKARFFARLGLDPNDRVHKRVYALMKLEAAEGRRRLLEGQSSTTAQIHEAAWSREVVRIYDEARTETKAVYRFGHDADRDPPDNWIIRWLLWHVFRYRDYRNKNRLPRSPGGASESGSSDDEQSRHGPTQTVAVSQSGGRALYAASAVAASSAGYYDPVREQWQQWQS